MDKPTASKNTSSIAQEKSNYLTRVFPIRKALNPFRPTPAPILQVDEEISLRSLSIEDVDLLFELVENNREHLQAWLSWISQIKTIEDTKAFVKGVRYKNIFAGRWIYGVLYNNELVGLLDFNEGNKALNQLSIGYWLSKKMEGKGIITRAVHRCLTYVFDEQHVHRVLIKCATQNQKSQAIPMRLNFSWEGIEVDAGTLGGESVDLVVYSMLYSDWEHVRHLSHRPT